METNTKFKLITKLKELNGIKTVLNKHTELKGMDAQILNKAIDDINQQIDDLSTIKSNSTYVFKQQTGSINLIRTYSREGEYLNYDVIYLSCDQTFLPSIKRNLTKSFDFFDKNVEDTKFKQIPLTMYLNTLYQVTEMINNVNELKNSYSNYV